MTLSEPPLPTGRYCYAAWTIDENGQRSAASVAWIDYVDTFGPPPSSPPR